jgi:hypothetical protein
MARQARVAPGGLVYHVLNRAVARLPLFRKVGDFEAFERVLLEAQARQPTRILAWCLMRNHWHRRKTSCVPVSIRSCVPVSIRGGHGEWAWARVGSRAGLTSFPFRRLRPPGWAWRAACGAWAVRGVGLKARELKMASVFSPPFSVLFQSSTIGEVFFNDQAMCSLAFRGSRDNRACDRIPASAACLAWEQRDHGRGRPIRARSHM